MKCAALLLLVGSAFAQAGEVPKNILLADVGLHMLGLGYQRSLSSQVALQVSVGIYLPWTQNQNAAGLSGEADRGDVAGIIVRARAFIYPDAHAPTGFWMSPFFQAGPATETRDGVKQSGSVWALGASAGWAWLIKRTVHVALGVGLQYHASHFPAGPGFGRFYPTIDGNLGWAF